MKTVDLLIKEHEIISIALEKLQSLADLFKQGNEGNISVIDEIRELISFLEFFVEKVHLYKEENIAFEEFKKFSAPEMKAIINAVSEEHKQIIQYHKDMKMTFEGLTQEGEASEIINLIKNYTELFNQHFWKELHALYQDADEFLTLPIDEKLSKEFQRHNQEIFKSMPENFVSKYQELLENTRK